MSIIMRIVIALGSIALISSLVFIVYSQIELKKQQTVIQTQVVAQQQLLDGISRSSSQFASKQDLQDFANANKLDLKTIQDNLNKLNAQLVSINVITSASSGETVSNVPTSSIGPANPTTKTPTIVPCLGGVAACPDTDPYNYQKNEQDLTLNEPFANNVNVPFGTVGFSAWQQNPWSLKISSRKYNISTVVGENPNTGEQVFYNKFSVNVNGKDYDLPITSAKTEQQVVSPTFNFWNPRVMLTAGPAVDITHLSGDANLGAAFQFMSWGNSKINPTLSVLELGAGYQMIDKSATVILNPVSVNIGKIFNTKLISNTYIGPSVQLDTKGNLFTGLNISLGL